MPKLKEWIIRWNNREGEKFLKTYSCLEHVIWWLDELDMRKATDIRIIHKIKWNNRAIVSERRNRKSHILQDIVRYNPPKMKMIMKQEQ